MTTKKTIDYEWARATEHIQPIVDYCSATPGAMAKIRRAYIARTGKNIGDGTIQRWLHPVAEKRMEPRYGAGLVLVAAASEVMGIQIQWAAKEANQWSTPK